MAKKKSETTEETKTPAKKPAAKKTTAKKSTTHIGTPLVDTNMAARVAANLIGNKAIAAGQPATGAQPRKPSSSFQQMKDSLNKPSTSAAVGNLLGDIQGKKQQAHQGFANQKGHNQTFGSDASKAFVPRRTGG